MTFGPSVESSDSYHKWTTYLSHVHTVAENGECRRKRRLSPKTATVAEIGDYSRQCGQAITA